MDELAAAYELDRRVVLRGAQELVPAPCAWVVRHRGLIDVHGLNAVRLAAPLPHDFSADELEAIVDRCLDGLPHRHVVLDDGDAGERLTDALTERGWERHRTLWMAFRADPRQAIRDPRAREISDDELRDLQRAALTEENHGPYASPGLPAQLVDAQALLRAGTTARGFGAGQSGALASMATLFLDPDVDGLPAAMIEQVATLRAHRQQGLARAVVSAALRAAGEWGAGLIVVPVDADDWPQLLYAGLGFAPIGHQWAFTLRQRAPGGSGLAAQ
ncbi:MAG: GNAT family N-acetyltransferase [Solirubrobacteraceae bacterium]